MRARRGLFCLAMMVLFATTTPATVMMTARDAYAQDGWGVRGGSARTKVIIRRYKILLERNPTQGLAYRKLLELTGRGRGLDALIKEYEGKLKKKPDSWRYAVLLGHFFKEKGEYQKSYDAYDAAVKNAPKQSLGYLGRGTAATMLQKNKEANADFEQALKLERNKYKKQAILRKLADVAFAQRDWERAQDYYDRLVRLSPRDEALRMEYAQVLVKYKRFDKAVVQYEALIRLAGRNVKARATGWRDLGDLYEKMGDDKKALEAYRKAQSYVRTGNWLHREVEHRIINVYRRTERLEEFIAARAKRWRNPSYDQSMILGDLYDEVGREDDALAMYRRAQKRSGRRPEPRMKIIQILQRRGLDTEVRKAYEALIRVAPNEHRYQFELARIHARNGDMKKTEAILSRIRARFRRSPDALVTLADTYMRLGLNKKALGVYQQLVRAYPRNDSYILSLGEYYYQNGDTEKALKTWKRVLRADLSKADANARLGEVLVTHEMIDQGIKYYEKAAKLAPKDRQIQRGLARAYEQGRRWERAVASWEKLMNGKDAQPHQKAEARGRIIGLYRRQGKLRTKMREYERRFKTSKDTEAGLLLAESHMKYNEHKKAEAVYRRLIALDGKTDAQDVEALVALEKVLSKRGQIAASIKVLQQLAELRPRRAKEYYHRIAELSLKTYDDNQAVRYARLALEQNPDDANAHARMGRVWAKMQQYDKAIKRYKVALDLDPRAFKVYMELAPLLLRKGDRVGAMKLYREAAKRSFDEGFILQASRKAVGLARTLKELEALEGEFAPMVFRTPPRPVYRDIMIELYGRMTLSLVAQRKFSNDSAQARKLLRPIAGRAFPILVDALQSDDMRLRTVAVRMLGDLQVANASITLARMVHNPQEALRVQAASAVALIGNERASVELIRSIDDSSAVVRDMATWALGATGGDAARKALIKALEGGQSSIQQSLAAVSLARIGGDASATALRKAVEQGAPQQYADSISLSALWGIGWMRDRNSAALLVKVYQRGGATASELAAWALGRIGDERAVAALMKGYWSGDSTRRADARRALLQLGAQSKTPDMFLQITQEVRFADPVNSRFDARRLLLRLRTQTRVLPARPNLTALYRHEGIIARTAREALGKKSTRGDVLYDLGRPGGSLGLGVEDRSDAAHTRHARLLKVLLPELRSIARKSVKGSAESLLMIGIAGHVADLPLLLSNTKDPNARRRERAHRALGVGFPSSRELFPVIVRGLGDDDFAVRLAAADTAAGLRVTPSDVVVQALVARLKDSNLSVQLAAARALGRARVESAVPALQGALKRAPRLLEIELVRALANMPGQTARAAIAPYRDHADLRLRKAATPPSP